MLQLVAALQSGWLAAVLIAAAATKLLDRHAAESVRATALTPVLGPRRALPAYRMLGILELLVGTLLLTSLARTASAIAATVLAMGFIGYLTYARRRAPESGCGCLHSRGGPTPVSWRSFARAGLMLVAGFLAIRSVRAADYWLDVLLARPFAAAAVLIAETLALVVLSPELRGIRGSLPRRHVGPRLPRPLLAGSGLTVRSSIRQLHESPAYHQVAGLLDADIVDSWRDESWQILCYDARYEGRPATAAFAVPLRRYDPRTVRVTLVDEFSGDILFSSDVLRRAASASTR
jgi:hypothetical protein